jgi:hypothetical protein
VGRRYPALILAVVVILSGCTGSTSGPATGGPPSGEQHLDLPQMEALEHHEMVAEYHEAAQELDWPPGASYPDTLPELEPAPDPDGGGELLRTVYEVGFGITVAEHYWFCAWAEEWLDTRSDDALDMLVSYPDSYSYQFAYEASTRASRDEMLTSAQLGDPGRISNYVGHNCDHDG